MRIRDGTLQFRLAVSCLRLFGVKLLQKVNFLDASLRRNVVLLGATSVIQEWYTFSQARIVTSTHGHVCPGIRLPSWHRLLPFAAMAVLFLKH